MIKGLKKPLYGIIFFFKLERKILQTWFFMNVDINLIEFWNALGFNAFDLLITNGTLAYIQD